MSDEGSVGALNRQRLANMSDGVKMKTNWAMLCFCWFVMSTFDE